MKAIRLKDRLAAFTLIELLIVVAIIAILAAIAVPNFLEAQTRSKVSRAKADLRTLNVGLESYRVDDNRYPPDAFCYSAFSSLCPTDPDKAAIPLFLVTTPIAYLTSIPSNIFPNETDQPNASRPPQYRYFGQEWKDAQAAGHSGDPVNWPADGPMIYSLVSSGPNRISNLGEYIVFGVQTFPAKFPTGFPAFNAGPTAIYDPTNGTISEGDVITAGPGNIVF